MSTAIVTGASRGFGRAVASDLARAGWNLVVDARGGPELLAASADIDALGPGNIVAIPGDVTDPGHAAQLVAAAGGDLTLLINNASRLGPSPQPYLADYPIDTFEQVLASNLVAPLRLIQLALPTLRSTHGTVVNVTSDAAVEGYEGWGGYGASKAGLEHMSRILTAEEPDVTVYWFDPGDMRTTMQQEAFPDEDISDRPLPETRSPALMRVLNGDHPSGRYLAEQMLPEVTRS
jgi:NAD(P)-dependent dehydrogenase (short-subunit alcohol dehydrogenase family)